MGKRKKTRRKRGKINHPKTSSSQQRKIKMVELVGFIASIIGIISIFAFWPKIKLDSSSPLDPAQPFSSPFVVSNESCFAIRSVYQSYRIINIQAVSPNVKTLDIKNMTINIRPSVITKLNPDDRSTLMCDFSSILGIPMAISEVQMEITLKYKYLWVIPCSKQYKFRTLPEITKQLRWVPMSS